MKQCPTCGATCFDDMEVCYGCLHRFRVNVDNVKTVQDDAKEKEPRIARADKRIVCDAGKHAITVPAISVVPVPGLNEEGDAPGDFLVVKIQVPRSAQMLTVGYGAIS